MFHVNVVLFAGTAVLVLCAALPVKVQPPATSTAEPDSKSYADDLEYRHYLKEVVDALETDHDFRQKLSVADPDHIKTGEIAHQLEYVNHNVRTKLDELKRVELDRLRNLIQEQYRLKNHIDDNHLKIAEHVDHDNPNTFEIADLQKLILKTSGDLAEADRKRREEFKVYEMAKEFEKKEKMSHLNEADRKAFEEQQRQQAELHNKHEPVHYPGNKAQLEEVWEKQDHMDPEDFNPKTFFMIHDLDSNGYWDENEVKALFVKELDKVYQSNHSEDDMRERVEEMERMREEVFKRADRDHDDLISMDEFLRETELNEFKEDPNWNTVDNTPQFTHEDYVKYEQQQQEHINQMIAEGKLPPHPNMPYGSYDGSNDINQHPNPAGQQPHYQQAQQQQQQQHQQYQQQQQQYQQQQQQDYQHQQVVNQQQQQQQQPPQYQQQQQPPQYQQQPQPQINNQQQQPPQNQQQQQPPQYQQQPNPAVQQQQINNQPPPQYQQQQQPNPVAPQQHQQPPPAVAQQPLPNANNIPSDQKPHQQQPINQAAPVQTHQQAIPVHSAAQPAAAVHPNVITP